MSRGKTKVASLPGVPNSVWHEGYNMFRQWTLDSVGGIISEEVFLDLLLRNTPHQVVYSLLDDKTVYEMKNVNRLLNETPLPETEREQLIKVRIGQGEFKKKLKSLDCACKICGLKNEPFLIASHIKPWSKSTDEERLDVYNGFLLCPAHDSLFDKGYISFEEDGSIIISPSLDNESKRLLQVDEFVRIEIEDEHKKYLKWHREEQLNF